MHSRGRDLAAYAARLPVPVIPRFVTDFTISAAGPDPTLSLGPGHPQANQSFTVPVLLDDPHPQGSTGMVEAVIALSYDPAMASIAPSDITLGSIPGSGAPWRLDAAVDATTGQIGIMLYSTSPIASSEGGSLVNMTFHARAGACPRDGSTTAVNW